MKRKDSLQQKAKQRSTDHSMVTSSLVTGALVSKPWIYSKLFRDCKVDLKLNISREGIFSDMTKQTFRRFINQSKPGITSFLGFDPVKPDGMGR